jgi:integrase
VIHQPHGGPYPLSIRNLWEPVIKDAGLDYPDTPKKERVVPHVLRHTGATWLKNLGAPLQSSAELLGMSAITLERTYGQWSLEGQRPAARSFAQMPANKHLLATGGAAR